MGRLVRDPEISYTKSATPLAVAKYTLAVSRRFKRDGESETDFINCVAFGKLAEFTEKYMTKGSLMAVIGRIQVNQYEDKNKEKRTSFNIVVEEQYFAESKKNDGKTQMTQNATKNDDDLPF